jgi:signal transduction histidine kinase
MQSRRLLTAKQEFMDFLSGILNWFTGGRAHNYMRLDHCMDHDYLWIGITVGLDFAVAAGYCLIAMHWWRNQRTLPDTPAKRALGTLRNIFIFCGVCGYIFIPIKMVWPAWRLYDIFMAVLVYYTWRYAIRSRELKVVYNELGRTSQLVEDLAASQRESQQKSSFLNAISHDLKTPLNGLMLQTELALISAREKDEQVLEQSLQEIKSSARTAAELLDSLLECARLDWAGDTNNLQTFDLAQELGQIANSFTAVAAQKSLGLYVNLPQRLFVRTDKVKLHRILSNLLNNAIKFTDSGHIRLELEQSRTSIEIHVIDTGIGIAPEHQERLFNEFYQVHNVERDRTRGFGLGLAIARRLARHLDGELAVQSAQGAGSRFTLLLPDVVVPEPQAVQQGNGELLSSP